MDTSETYIKMCDCPEIQDHRPNIQTLVWCTGICHEHGNTYWQKPGRMVFGGSSSRKVIWLPRQDQLQEMVKWTTPFYHMLIELSVFYRDTAGIGELSSWEQLWLAFVMKEKHGKVWAGTEWC